MTAVGKQLIFVVLCVELLKLTLNGTCTACNKQYALSHVCRGVVSSTVDWKHNYAGHVSLESGQPAAAIEKFLCTKADVVVMCWHILSILVHLVNYCRAKSEASNCGRGGHGLAVLVIS